MQIGLIQVDTVWQDRDANLTKARSMIERLAPAPGTLLLLPEMFASGFSMDVRIASDSHDRLAEQFCIEMAKTHGVHIVAGIVSDASDDRGYNEAVAFDPAGLLQARYRKRRLFTPVGEERYYLAGDRPALFHWGAFTVSPLICYDLRFPELFTEAADQGADLFLVLANWPTLRLEHWQTLLKARAIENQAYVAGVNRCGSDSSADYPGASQVYDPTGQLIASASADEQALICEIDQGRIVDWRRRFPALRDGAAARKSGSDAYRQPTLHPRTFAKNQRPSPAALE